MQTSTTQKKKFSFKDLFFSTSEQICRKVTVKFFIFAKEIFNRKLQFLQGTSDENLLTSYMSAFERYLCCDCRLVYNLSVEVLPNQSPNCCSEAYRTVYMEVPFIIQQFLILVLLEIFADKQMKANNANYSQVQNRK